jgi:hypothetical protein
MSPELNVVISVYAYRAGHCTGPNVEGLIAFALRSSYLLSPNVAAPTSQRQGLACMSTTLRNHPDEKIVPLRNAVFCLDCEVISNSHGDECPSCRSRSVVALARMLGGSLLANRTQRRGSVFDITIAVELHQVNAKDLSTIVERLTGVFGPHLAEDSASFHIGVKPTVDTLHLQGSLSFPKRDAA